MAYIVRNFDDHTVLCHVSDVQQGFCERVQRNLRSDSVFLLEYIEGWRAVVVLQIQVICRVGRSEVVLGIL